MSVVAQAPFSLWDYLREELLATDFDSHQEMKWERVSNFLHVPFAVEKIIGIGIILCFDSFLYTFTILPIRAVLAWYRLCMNWASFRNSLPPSQKADILRAMLLIVSLAILAPLTDPSKIYHTIRLQESIKLYVIFNAVEIADRLCTSIGQDIIDCLFSRSTLAPLSRNQPVTRRTFLPIVYFGLAVLYTVAHTLVLIYQLISLNVAINSYDHSLLTLLVSNQFVEIKGSVFKKFEKDNLFQITCADIVERFQLLLMMFSVAGRNLIELSGTEFDASAGVPSSFRWFPGHSLVWTIFSPVATVMLSEVAVDWLKHAFITKFNHIRPSVYERYMDVLCLDLASGSAIGRHGARKHTYVDQSPLVARRLGFAALPLACLTIIIAANALDATMSSSPAHLASLVKRNVKYALLLTLAWICLVVVKIIIGVNLITYATHRRVDMEQREAEDVVNDFGRDPIGESKDERRYNRELKSLLLQKKDDATRAAEMGERKGGGDRKRPNLNELTRFTMVKQIW